MRKNWLFYLLSHWFRTKPPVPDAAFQGDGEEYPGHWRRFPEPWPNPDGTPSEGGQRMAEMSGELDSAMGGLPPFWRRVLIARGLAGGDDRQVAAQFGLTLRQERDILARARSAVRDRLERARMGGGR
jgi:RNA polymerase sigma-70 factor, ECF subfamily